MRPLQDRADHAVNGHIRWGGLLECGTKADTVVPVIPDHDLLQEWPEQLQFTGDFSGRHEKDDLAG